MSSGHDLPTQVQIVYTDVETDLGAKFLGDRRVTRVGPLDTDRLGDNLTALCRQVDHMLQRVEDAAGSFELAGFDLTVEVAATGEIRLVGSVSAEVRGGVTLRFSRRGGES